MDEGVRTQKLRDFTVQIRRADNNAIVGTGVAVSTDGKIVTCAHVVRAAGVEPRRANGAEIGVYFPAALGGEEKNRRAMVVKYFEDFEDDIVLLQLTGGRSPLAPEQIAVVGSTGNLSNRDFESFGYRSLGQKSIGKFISGGPARGKILGTVELYEGSNFHREPLMLESNQLNAGMSGAGVLDVEDNLVVGIVSHIYDPDKGVKDQDTALGVDARVLPLPPFDFPIRTEPLPKGLAPTPKFDTAQAHAAVFLKEKYALHTAPAVLPEWTGREHLLAQITADWNDPRQHVTGLIGFGGEGKSSLARKWLETLLSPLPLWGEGPGVRSDGAFWWGFYENRSVDEFLEAALNYLSGGRIDPRAVPSSSLRAQIIGAMLGSGRYLFVLDGLEVMQHEDGDRYGLLQSNDLRDLLAYFARPDHESFCLVTSRAPLLDLMDYTTYTHRDVDRLSPADGRALLKRLGVKGSDLQLDTIIADWDGHALTLSLLGSYLSEHFGGEIAHLADIPAPTADEPRYERVHRVLRRYDEHLTQEEREFLKLFSAFRTPVHESAFEKVFVPLLANFTAKGAEDSLTAKTAKEKPIPDSQFPIPSLVARLVHYRLLRHDAAAHTYTAHPLVRNHYLAHLTRPHLTPFDAAQGRPDTQQPDTKDIHNQIKEYYLSLAGDTPRFPTLDDLKPLIEAVHHACQAGAYDEAHEIRNNHIDEGERFVLTHQLGAFETELEMMFEFFPKRDTRQEPRTSNPNYSRWILNMIGACLMSLGRLHEAVPFYERKNKIALKMQDWRNLSNGYQNLAELQIYLGALDKSTQAAEQALEHSLRAGDKNNETRSLFWQAWVAHLVGNVELAETLFFDAERLNREVVLPGQVQYLHSFMGIGHTEHLRRCHMLDYARRVAKANLQICHEEHWENQISWYYRVIGDLDVDSNDHASAHTNYEAALKIARRISVRYTLIEALLARGRWVAKNFRKMGELGSLDQAFNDLNEALGYCVESGYRIYEADVRVGLAWAWLAPALPLTPGPSPSGRGESLAKAKAEAERALQMSEEMGYYWGVVDAREVLEGMGEMGHE